MGKHDGGKVRILTAPGIREEVAYDTYDRVIRFFCELYQKPELLADLLAGVDCRADNKEFVAFKYRKMFGPGIDGPTPRHLRWYRRMAPVFAVPCGGQVLDYGGGYGIDALFFAALGYRVYLYEITPDHLAIARAFANWYSARFGTLSLAYIEVGRDPEPRNLEAVMIKEAAHHIEPVQPVFNVAARMLKRGGHLFLLEPNYWNPAIQANFFRIRGFRTVEKRRDSASGHEYLVGNEHIRSISAWRRHATAAGFVLSDVKRFVPWSRPKAKPTSGQQMIEGLPIVRDVVASHLTMHFVRQ
jgi:SAM-dependent methyltransferase